MSTPSARGTYPSSYATSIHDERGIWTLGCQMTLLATGARTGGSLAVIHEISGPDTRPPLHIHHDADEACYVLSGSYIFQVADERIEASPGTFVFIPRNVPHTFSVPVDRAEMLLVYTPGGFEGYFESLGEPAQRRDLPPTDLPIDIARANAVAADFHCDIVGPPLDHVR